MVHSLVAFSPFPPETAVLSIFREKNFRDLETETEEQTEKQNYNIVLLSQVFQMINYNS